jgi:hypothetical protein
MEVEVERVPHHGTKLIFIHPPAAIPAKSNHGMKSWGTPTSSGFQQNHNTMIHVLGIITYFFSIKDFI